MIRKIRSDRRVQILLVLIVLAMASFWMTSRYPSLDAKSMMAGSISLADGLSFDAWIPHGVDDSLPRQIATTYLNWLHTNLQGMSFGLTIAILFMTLLPIVRDELDFFLTRRFSATLAGALLGAPLGVCVNCAAPVGYAMYKQGARLEAALALMISSPTLNIVVLSMAFTLFPFYLVGIKLLASLITILVLIPFVVSRFPEEALTAEPLEDAKGGGVGSLSPTDPSLEREFTAALKWLGTTLTRQTWVVLKQIFPIMLLAGLLGAAAVVLAPWDELAHYLPQEISTQSVLVLLLISAFGLFLPVPIAFDVVLCALLIHSGIPIQYVASLFFVLGSFSIYSLFVVLKAKATKSAWSLTLALTLLGCIVGLSSKLAQDIHTKSWQSPLFAELAAKHEGTQSNSSTALAGGPPSIGGRANGGDREASAEHTPESTIAWEEVFGTGRISRFRLAHRGKNLGKFTRIPPSTLGLRNHLKPFLLNLVHDTPDSNGISGGDFDDDGWFDLLFSTSDGILVYRNIAGSFKLYTRITGDNPDRSLEGAAAFADLDNDKQVDIIFSEDASGLWISYNREGIFQPPIKLEGVDQHIAKAIAILDIDRDSDLDFVVGNISHVMSKRPSTSLAQNVLYQREGDSYRMTRFPEPFGETLSIFLADTDQNGDVNLFIANDYDEPDVYLSFDESSGIRSLDRRKIRLSTQTSMSIDAADIDNDLDLEIFIAQATSNPVNGGVRIQQRRNAISKRCEGLSGSYCELAKALAIAREASRKNDATVCETLENDFRTDCIAVVYLKWLRGKILQNSLGPRSDRKGIRKESLVLRDQYPEMFRLLEHLNSVDLLSERESREKFAEFVPQQRKINALLELNEHGDYENRSEAYGLDIAGWAWNSRFADLDGDEWQDLYVVNGWTPSDLETSNVLFHNIEGERFLIHTQEFGLIDFEPTISYTYIDYDNDGDLDIISYSLTGRTAVYRNDFHSNHSIQFELRDEHGNYFGIGSVLVIRYGEKSSKHQMREIKMSGGHLSFDPKIAHFGIGKEDRVHSVEVQWSTGEKETFRGPFEPGYRYRITRPERSSVALGDRAS